MEDTKPSFYEVVVLPAEQELLNESDNTVAGIREGEAVILERGDEPGEPVWAQFVPERSLGWGFRIPFYERRIRRAKKNAARYATVLAFEKVEVSAS